MPRENDFDRIVNNLAEFLRSTMEHADAEAQSVVPFGQQVWSNRELQRAWPTMSTEERMAIIRSNGVASVLESLRGGMDL